MPDEEKVDGSLGNEPINTDPTSDLSKGDQGAEDGKTDDAMSKMNKRFDDMRKQNDRDRDVAKSEAESREARLLAIIEGGTTAKSSQEDQQAARQAKADFIKNYDEGEIDGEKQWDLLSGIAQDARESALEGLKGTLTAGEQERKEMRVKLEALETNSNPAYVANKAKIDEAAQKYGVTHDQAMKIVADMKPSQPARPDTAGGLGGTGVTGDDDGAGDTRVSNIVAGLAAAVTGRKPTEAAMKKHNQKWGKK